MLGENRAQDLLKHALQLAGAAQTEILIQSRDDGLTRFSGNLIHQNVAETNVNVTVRVVDGQRAGRASTTNLSDESLSKAAEQAHLHARQQPEDPDFPGLPDPEPITAAAVFDEATAGFSPAARAQAVGAVCSLAAEQRLKAYGAFTTGVAETAIANSRGVMAYHTVTYAVFETVIMGEDGSARSSGASWKADEVDAESIGRAAVAQALRAQNPRKIEPGVYTVVAGPHVTADLVAMLSFEGVGADMVQEGRSWMNDRIGQRLMSPLVSIWDDGGDLAGMPMPLDYEGMPRQRVSIVDQGVIGGPVYDRYTAAKEGRRTTGHASPPDSPFFRGPLTSNLFMAGGDASVEGMIQSTQRGLYLSHFWYTRPVHPRECVVTGMTRDGVFMIENGELAYPVKDLRFTQSYVKALADVEAVGRETHLLADGDLGMILAVRVPALKIANFNFTGVTV